MAIMDEQTYNGIGGTMSIGTKKIKVLENYMVVEHGDYQAGFKTMEQCLNYVREKGIDEYQIWNVAKTKIKVLVKENKKYGYE